MRWMKLFLGVLSGVSSKLYLYLALAVTLISVICGVYFYGKSVARHEVAIEQLKADVDARVKREGVSDDISAMDRYSVCISLGGLHDDCDELRGLEESSEAK